MHRDTESICRLATVTGGDGRNLARHILDALEDEDGGIDTSERLRAELRKYDRHALERIGGVLGRRIARNRPLDLKGCYEIGHDDHRPNSSRNGYGSRNGLERAKRFHRRMCAVRRSM